jgi:hypothetical protein
MRPTDLGIRAWRMSDLALGVNSVLAESPGFLSSAPIRTLRRRDGRPHADHWGQGDAGSDLWSTYPFDCSGAYPGRVRLASVLAKIPFPGAPDTPMGHRTIRTSDLPDLLSETDMQVRRLSSKDRVPVSTSRYLGVPRACYAGVMCETSRRRRRGYWTQS